MGRTSSRKGGCPPPRRSEREETETCAPGTSVCPCKWCGRGCSIGSRRATGAHTLLGSSKTSVPLSHSDSAPGVARDTGVRIGIRVPIQPALCESAATLRVGLSVAIRGNRPWLGPTPRARSLEGQAGGESVARGLFLDGTFTPGILNLEHPSLVRLAASTEKETRFLILKKR